MQDKQGSLFLKAMVGFFRTSQPYALIHFEPKGSLKRNTEISPARTNKG